MVALGAPNGPYEVSRMGSISPTLPMGDLRLRHGDQMAKDENA